MIWTAMETRLGRLVLVGDDHVLRGLYIRTAAKPWELDSTWRYDPEAFPQSRRQVTEYLEGSRRVFDVAFSLAGSAFQRRVWDALLEIPYGETTTYAELARKIGAPAAARAVGAANGRNPISIIVPCHRVVGSNQQLTGYGGGLENKQLLLDLEARPAGRTA